MDDVNGFLAEIAAENSTNKTQSQLLLARKLRERENVLKKKLGTKDRK